MNNLKTRIEKLEQVGNSAKCECSRVKMESYDCEGQEPQLMSEPVPDVCEKCRKPIKKTIIRLSFME